MAQPMYTLNGYTMTGEQVLMLAMTEQKRAEAAEARAGDLVEENRLQSESVEMLRAEIDELKTDKQELQAQLARLQIEHTQTVALLDGARLGLAKAYNDYAALMVRLARYERVIS